jgi:transcriptional regulator with XRE-family HTH domain
MKRTRKTVLDPYAVLAQRIAKAGTQKQLAEELGISLSYLNDVYRKRRNFSASLLEKLGMALAAVNDQ